MVAERWLRTPCFPICAAARNLPLASRARLDKQRLPGVLAVAGTSVLAFRKPDTVGDHSFQDIRMDCSKGRKTHRQAGMRQGASGLPDNLDPVQDCRRPRRNANSFNGLIAQPAQTGEDRISLWRRFLAACGPIWFEPRHPAPSGSGGQAFQCRLARRVRWTGVLRSGFG